VNLVKALEKVEYMSKEWFDLLASLNKLIYTTYGLEENEITFIENIIKEIQSSRWHNDG
jgi:hypothetical protein